MPMETPDIIAGKDGRILAIEIKYCSSDRQYIRYEEKKDLEVFSECMGAQAWIAVKYSRRGWYFIPSKNIQSSGKHYVISFLFAKENGKSKEEIAGKTI